MITLISLSPLQAQMKPIDSELSELIIQGDDIHFLEFKSNVKLPPQELFSKYAKAFGLTPQDNMRIMETTQDELGFIHYKHQQFHNDIKVEGGEYIVHQRNGDLISSSGSIISEVKNVSQPSVTAQQAIQMAQGFVKAEKYMWESNQSLYPKPELLYVADSKDLTYKGEDFRLAYKVDIYSAEPYDRNFVYVDASTGAIIKSISRIRNCTPSTVNTLYNRTQNFTAEATSGGQFKLQENCAAACGGLSRNLRVSKFEGIWASSDITNTSTTWDGTISDRRRIGASVQWALEKTFDYFACSHSRNSFDGRGAHINAVLGNNGQGVDNAFWDGSRLNFGDGMGGLSRSAMVSLDVVGHEFSHAVNEHSANLRYEGESGALDEGFSDIFGTAVEFFGQGGVGDYDIAEDMWIAGGKLRSMSNPNSKNDADTYGGRFWINTVGCSPSRFNDECGVHINSGVLNFWFYLLSEGGAGTNDLGNAFNVAGIGRAEALAIAYRTLTRYLTSTSNFANARTFSIRAAADLFGSCSNQVIQTMLAWHAVGVGGEISPHITGTFSMSAIQFSYHNISAGSPGLTRINAPFLVSFVAQNEIQLNEGFEVNEGATFTASIGVCSGALVPSLPSMARGRQSTNTENVIDTPEDASSETENLIDVFPNPSDHLTTIQITVPDQANVSLTLYDINSYAVKQILNGQTLSKGTHTFDLCTSELPAGLYYCTTIIGSKREVRKIMVIH